MSNSIEVRAFYDAIEAAVQAAWNVSKVYPEQPRVPIAQAELPYAVAAWQPVSIAFQAVGRKNSLEHSYTFVVGGVFPWPSDPEAYIAFEKADRANELIAQLQTGPTFGTFGYLPLVSQVDPSEDDDEFESTYSVRLTFEVRATADHS